MHCVFIFLRHHINVRLKYHTFTIFHARCRWLFNKDVTGLITTNGQSLFFSPVDNVLS
ncbi:Uncharacterised protein [Vibrio cholerae]|nr:Uncharacterised protein [Vibrio cholerae]CSI02772.1 Uncharacterised protein [Vibrio cholerae]